MRSDDKAERRKRDQELIEQIEAAMKHLEDVQARAMNAVSAQFR